MPNNRGDYLADLLGHYNESRVPAEPGAAAGFRDEVAQYPERVGQRVIEMQALFRGKRVLKVACGAGKFTQFAADVAAHVVATDIAPNLLANARTLPFPKGNVHFVECDAFRGRSTRGCT